MKKGEDRAPATYVYTNEDLKTMQSWSLERKIRVTQTRIIEWYQHYEGKVYVSFSGGKDSTVLLDLVRRIYPDVEAVFVDTGLEFPEIREFVKTFDNVTWLRPEKPFHKVIEEYGYPVVSKEVAMYVEAARRGTNYAVMGFRGLNIDGSSSNYKRDRLMRWAYLLDAPFKISNACCKWIKEKPAYDFIKKSGSKPFLALMADESQRRKNGYRKSGCNAFNSAQPRSTPMGFWTEQDVLQYIKQFNIPYASVYGDIVEVNKGSKRTPKMVLRTTGEARTGCMFCMFGCHLHKVNRFQRMAVTHPKQYDYCINKLGCGKVLDYIGVDYSPIEKTE